MLDACTADTSEPNCGFAFGMDGLMDSSLSVRCTAPTSPKTLNKHGVSYYSQLNLNLPLKKSGQLERK